MGDILTKGTLFPPQLTNELFSLVKGKSSLARLSGAEPVPFNGKEIFTFTLDQEIGLVAENAAKSNGGATIAPVTMEPVKVEYGFRVSDEFKYASEEIQLQYLRSFADGFAKKVARGLDIMALHGVNPRTKTAATTLATKNFDSVVTQIVTFVEASANTNVEDAIELVTGNEIDVTGLAMSPTFKSALAKIKVQTGSQAPLFPELGWGNDASSINGLPVDTNSTVSFNNSDDRAFVGNFADYFRWGIAREIPIEVIEYGNPDNSESGDLKGHNQVYIRGEAYIGWAILDPDAFALISDSETSI